jgi:hypothetical protein
MEEVRPQAKYIFIRCGGCQAMLVWVSPFYNVVLPQIYGDPSFLETSSLVDTLSYFPSLLMPEPGPDPQPALQALA